MFYSANFLQDEPFSPQLMYSLTAQCFTMTEMRHLHQQTELLKQLATHMEKNVSTRTTIDDEKEIDATAIDETRSQLEISITEDTPHTQVEKVTLLSDCKIRRIQEEDEVLKQIQKKCTSNCYNKVKELFDNLRQQTKSIKQMESQIELNRKINSNLLQFKEQNDFLRAELEKAISTINSKQEERQKIKVLEQRNMNKQTSILKSEKNLLLKEKRIIEMKKKVQAIFENVTRQVQGISSEINSFINCYREAAKGNQPDKYRWIDEKSNSIANLWKQFERSFKSKLQ